MRFSMAILQYTILDVKNKYFIRKTKVFFSKKGVQKNFMCYDIVDAKEKQAT